MSTAIKAAQKGVAVSLLTATTTGTGIAVAIPITSFRQNVTIIGAGTITGGSVVLEESHDPNYSGTWSNLYTVAGTTLSAGACQVFHIDTTVRFLRQRIASDITGGGSIAGELVTS